jgi:hypothetical protein
MSNPRVWLYVVCLALLATHQVDAAFWHEWDVFGVPGGLPFFLVFNLVAMILLSAGLVSVSARGPLARASALGCAGTGALTCALHAVFLTRDATAFWAPASLGILTGILVASIALAASASRRRPQPPPTGHPRDPSPPEPDNTDWERPPASGSTAFVRWRRVAGGRNCTEVSGSGWLGWRRCPVRGGWGRRTPHHRVERPAQRCTRRSEVLLEASASNVGSWAENASDQTS